MYCFVIYYNVITLTKVKPLIFAGILCTELSQGIIFEKQRDTVLNENQWRLVLDFNIKDLCREIATIESLYENVRVQLTNLTKEQEVWFRDIQFELNKVKSSLDIYKSDLEDLLELLPNERFKRGLINAGGYAVKYLFGLATSDDLEETNAKVNVLQDIAKAVVHSRQDQITLLKDVNSKVGLNSKAIVEVMERLGNFSKKVKTELVELEYHWTMVFDDLVRYLYVCNEIRHLGQVMDEAKLRVAEFRQALEVVKTHRLSSKLLPPSEFHPILLNIERLMPTDVHLAVPVDVEELFLYYDLCEVQAISTKTSIRLIVTIPLTSTASQFETYKIHNLPVFNVHLNHWLSWKLNLEYLLISSDRQYYLPISNQDLTKCKENIYFWCSNIGRVKRNYVNDCYYLLFMGYNSSKSCPKVIRTDVTSPYLIRNGNDWIYSTDKPSKVSLKCWKVGQDNRLESNLIKDLELKETGILTNVSRCEIFGDSFRIFPRIQGNVKYQGNIHALHIPNIQGMLTVNEHKFIMENSNVTFQTLKKLKENLGNDTVEIRLNALLKELTESGEGLKVDYNVNVIIIVSICIVICTFVLLVMYVCFRKTEVGQRTIVFWSRRRPSHPNPSPSSPTIVMSGALQDLVQSRQETTSSS